jgi:hypothetical protein
MLSLEIKAPKHRHIAELSIRNEKFPEKRAARVRHTYERVFRRTLQL